jgi:hypothetical protein
MLLSHSRRWRIRQLLRKYRKAILALIGWI